MTGEEFVKLCFAEKKAALNEYFSAASDTEAAKRIQELIRSGVSRKELYELIDLIMTESYYTLLLGLDGAASLGGKQLSYQLYDEDGELLNECGEIEENAFTFFIEG